ncbi:hypothetical protein GCM10011581_14380 [Saccharopolyspora subtropica]|uniref:Uncharacterized protein n=1 Tax=Saccharopolyspora thermophila TaxID=89367 RepID=A0A917JNK1_9PSEU|nr:hypothetical protein [Saccharopolyspora subtropica]GGI78414.1 hypothetical protein GCM10011581_14380 [Saccharopolyspora subtropica]
MTARPDLGGSSAPATNPQPTPDRPAPLRAAIALTAVGAALVGLGPLAGLVAPGASAAFAAWPLLLPLALAAPALAAAFAKVGHPATAAALLIGPAVLAPGRLVLDLQFLVNAGRAARPELLRVDTLDAYTPSAGTWLLLAGHVASLVGGLLAVRGIQHGEESAGAHRQGLLTLVLCAGFLAAVAVLMAPFASDDPYLLPNPAVDAPLPVLVGSVLLAVGAPTAAGFFAGAGDPDVARGGLLGLAVALAGIVLPPLVAVAVLDQLTLAWGPVLGLVAVVALATLALPAGRNRSVEATGDLSLPTFTRLIALAAVFALIAGTLALVAAAMPQVEMPFGLRDPSPYPARVLWPAGGLLVLVGGLLLLPRVGRWLRPVLPVVWVVVPLAAAGVLDAVFTAMQAAEAEADYGSWAAGAAVLFAALAAAIAAVAGGVERDDVDLTEMAMHRLVLFPSLVALPLGAGAFSVPVVTASDYTAPGVFTAFSTASWGLVIALAAVVGAAVLAPMCRPQRAAALLCGAALVVSVRVLEYPLTAGRFPDANPGPGLWFGLACTAVLLGTALAAARSRRDPELA